MELNSALRSFTQASAGAVFSLTDVERLRSEDPNQEFFIIVVGDNKNKYFKVKSRFFKQLFGAPAEPTYSAGKPASAVNPKETGLVFEEAQGQFGFSRSPGKSRVN